jgi:hypothetical protein
MYVVASLYFEHAADGCLCKKIIGMYVCQGKTHTHTHTHNAYAIILFQCWWWTFCRGLCSYRGQCNPWWSRWLRLRNAVVGVEKKRDNLDHFDSNLHACWWHSQLRRFPWWLPFRCRYCCSADWITLRLTWIATGFRDIYCSGDQSSWSSWVLFFAHAGKRRQGMDFLCPRIISLHIICAPPRRKSMWVPWPHEVWHWIGCEFILALMKLWNWVPLLWVLSNVFRVLKQNNRLQGLLWMKASWLLCDWKGSSSVQVHILLLFGHAAYQHVYEFFEEGAGSSLHLSSSHC